MVLMMLDILFDALRRRPSRRLHGTIHFLAVVMPFAVVVAELTTSHPWYRHPFLLVVWSAAGVGLILSHRKRNRKKQ
jgi:hypothetical protein